MKESTCKLPSWQKINHFREMISSNVNKKKSTEHEDIITFDIPLGPPLAPADVMSTKVAPADDMSITVAPAGVVLVYKPRSTCLKKVMGKLFSFTVCDEHSSQA